MTQKRIILALAAAAVLAVVGVCCIRHGERAERASEAHGATRVSSGQEVAGAPPMAEALARAAVIDGGARDATNTPAPARPPQNNAVARAMRATDARDRTLLADIEERTHKAPPPAVHALIALRKQGKSRAELERFIADELAGDVVVRMLAMRWLDGREQPAKAAPLLKDGAQLDAPRQLKPIEKTTP